MWIYRFRSHSSDVQCTIEHKNWRIKYVRNETNIYTRTKAKVEQTFVRLIN